MSNQVPDELDDFITELFTSVYPANRKEARTAIQALITAEKKKMLNGLLEYNGAYIGMDGKRVDNMVHHIVIEEEIKKLNQVPSEGKAV